MTFSQGYALLIGVGSYKHHADIDVPALGDDCSALAALLSDPQRCGYPADNIVSLIDAAATRNALLSAFDQLAERTGPEDTIVVLYAAHGHYSAECPADSAAHCRENCWDRCKSGWLVSTFLRQDLS